MKKLVDVEKRASALIQYSFKPHRHTRDPVTIAHRFRYNSDYENRIKAKELGKMMNMKINIRNIPNCENFQFTPQTQNFELKILGFIF